MQNNILHYTKQTFNISLMADGQLVSKCHLTTGKDSKNKNSAIAGGSADGFNLFCFF